MLTHLKKSFVLIILIFNLFLHGTASITGADNSVKNSKATAFSLKDQFGNELSYKFPREKTTILAFADKTGSEQLEAWIQPLVNRYSSKYADKLDIQGVAELSSVPGIAKGVVRNLIKKKVDRPVMLDWKGDVSKSYSYEKDKVNVLLIDRQGNIVSREIGAADKTKLDSFYKKIDALLK